MGTGLLALGTVELEVVGFSGYSARAPLDQALAALPHEANDDHVTKDLLRVSGG